MMLDELLEKPGALDVVELQMVRDWLKALEGDETTFGNTPEDQRRMDAIRRRLSLEESRNG